MSSAEFLDLHSSTESLNQIFGPDGPLARNCQGYEYRPEQIRMAEAVLAAFRQGGHLCVEAGTGTGKTLAYLVPALLSGEQVILSTGTRALQEQLIHKDLPLLSNAFRTSISACVVKGRSNYVCLERLEAARHTAAYSGLFPAESLKRIVEWARTTETGDRAELTGIPEGFPEWKWLDARREICQGPRCDQYEQCFVTRVRRRAAESNLVIVNHHLFFADLAIKDRESGGILPDCSCAVFDEAHELEDIAAQFFGVQLGGYRFEEWTQDLTRACKKESRQQRTIVREGEKLLKSASRFFQLWRGVGNSGRCRLFSEGAWTSEEIASLEETRELVDGIGRLKLLLHYPGASTAIEELSRRLIEIEQNLRFLIAGGHENYVYWKEDRGRTVQLVASPVSVAAILRDKLFSCVRTAVLTSATLATNGHFRFICDRLGLDQTQELVLGSHFDFEQQAILYVPKDICGPRDEGFSQSMAEQVQELLSVTRGRAFVLFTSYQQMQKVHELLHRILPYPLLLQGEDSPANLLTEFRSTPGCVLFGTTSFWQGVDVQGEALSCVILEKIPFSVPTDPLIEARLERLRREGRDAFSSYQLPEAVILLKQGLGRLIRSRSDRGILAILDRRIWTHGYGREIRSNLPPCRLTDELPDVRRFFRR